MSVITSAINPTSSFGDFELVDAPLENSSHGQTVTHHAPSILSTQEVALRNLSFFTFNPIKEWNFFALKKHENGLLEVLPERQKEPCTREDDILKLLEDSFKIFQNSKNQKFAFFSSKVIEMIEAHGNELDKREDATTQIFLNFVKAWKHICPHQT